MGAKGKNDLTKEEGTVHRKKGRNNEELEKEGATESLAKEEGTILLQKGKSDRLGNQIDKKKKERCRRG